MSNESYRVAERRETIAEMLYRQGKVHVNELSKLFGISVVTIRNDLIKLEKEGLLKRTHGGAMSTTHTYFNMNFEERKKKNEQEKLAIAEKAAGIIGNDRTIMLNSGTTTFMIARALKTHYNLKIVTNSISIAMELSEVSGISVILLGGNINTTYGFTYGMDTIRQLQRYRSDILILSVDGLNVESGLTTYHIEEAEVSREMIRRVNRTIVAADFSKIAREGFTCVDSIDSIDSVITNRTSNEAEINQMIERGIEIIFA